MPFVPVPNTLQIDVIYLLDNQRVENTLYFEKNSTWIPDEIVDFTNSLRAYIEEELMPLLSSAIGLVEIVARLLDTASSIGFNLPVNPPVTGGVPTESLPNNVTYTISFKTGLTGRSFRGRNYVPGLDINAVTGNQIDATKRTALLDYYTGIRALALESSVTWVVVSRYSGVDGDGKPIPRATGVTTPITSVSTFDNTVDSQRRRLPGRGR